MTLNDLISTLIRIREEERCGGRTVYIQDVREGGVTYSLDFGVCASGPEDGDDVVWLYPTTETAPAWFEGVEG